MAIRVAINGFGRIGRAFFKQAFERPEIEIVAVNDLGSCENLAYLLRFDSVYGRYEREVAVEGGVFVVGGKRIQALAVKDPAALPWKDLQIDVVVESTGFFTHSDDAKKHLEAGAKRVVISAPAKGEVATVLLGINEDKFSAGPITCNASCTTNAVSPVAAIMMETAGVKKAILNTVHGYTASQNLVDGPVKDDDFLRGRAAAVNIVPSSTGAAEAVAKALTELDKLFTGISMRVPVVAGSIADFTFLAGRATTAEEINDILRKAAREPRWQNIFTVSEQSLVSADIIKNPYASIADLPMTRVVDGDLIKILAWYDNEWGYTTTLVEHIVRAAKHPNV
ncbi:aldehyde dehydrogenase [Candidatus Parcubacteria bacterium]|nr:aldehyde dehydrogenase [Candidatus Parcubacteria bacterium]MBI4385407.1 aldehyde dehydrogenase [Candidatus Parcubacteria bacterium]